MRILIAFEDAYRAYRDVVAAGIKILRPHAEVETVSLEALEERIEHFDPELVICGGRDAKHRGRWPAWVELSVDTLQPAKVWVDGCHSERPNPTFEVLLAVIDEVEKLIRANNHFRKY